MPCPIFVSARERCSSLASFIYIYEVLVCMGMCLLMFMHCLLLLQAPPLNALLDNPAFPPPRAGWFPCSSARPLVGNHDTVNLQVD